MAAHRKFTDTEKYCPKCCKWLLRSEFSRAAKHVSGLRSSCRNCNSVENAVSAAARRRKDIRWGLVKSAKQRAKAQGIPFSIRKEDLYVPLICPILGVPIRYGSKQAGPNSPSLDRSDPKLGYVPGNVFIISFRANAIKNDATADELEKAAKYTRMVQAGQ